MKWFKKKVVQKTKELKQGYWWRVVSFHRDRQARKAVDQLIENSRLAPSFFVMCSLSGILATLGLLLEDTAILIAAMVLAPLLNPVLAFAAGLAILNKHLIIYALKSFLGSVVFVILISALLAFVLESQGYDFDLLSFEVKFSKFDHLLFLAAFISGFSGVYAWLREVNASNIIGVAIAVSLIPFVSFMGILLGLGKYETFHSYALNFSLNIGTIIFGATSAFLLLGFSRQKEALSAEIESNTED